MSISLSDDEQDLAELECQLDERIVIDHGKLVDMNQRLVYSRKNKIEETLCEFSYKKLLPIKMFSPSGVFKYIEKFFVGEFTGSFMYDGESFMKNYHEDMNWQIKTSDYERTKSSLLNNYMLLTTEIAEIAEELRKGFNKTNTLINQGMEEEQAFESAKDSIKEDLGWVMRLQIV